MRASPALNLISMKKYISHVDDDDDYKIKNLSPRTVMKRKVNEMPIFEASRNLDSNSNYMSS